MTTIERQAETLAVLTEISKMVKDVRDLFYKNHSEDEDMEDFPAYTNVQTQLFELAKSISVEQGARISKDLFKSFEKMVTT